MFLTEEEIETIVDALNFMLSHKDFFNPYVTDFEMIDSVTVKVSAYYQSLNDKGYDIVEHENDDEALSEYNA